MHPLHTEQMLATWARMDPNYDPRRRTGRTTALALSLLARAISNPGVPFTAYDHYPTKNADRELLYAAHTIVVRLGWVGFTFNRTETTVRFG